MDKITHNVNKKRYENLNDAVAFEIAFEFMLYGYDDVGWDEYERYTCTKCGKMEQFSDFLVPKSNCKKDYAILQSYEYGVSIEIQEKLISNFDITNDDFRPVRNKIGDIVYYQITPQHTMKPIDSVNRMRKLKKCPKCNSVQYRINEYKNKKGFLFYYITQDALDDLCDLNRTFENFDMHSPRYIVSRRVFEFLSNQYPRMRFIPLFLKS